MPGTAAACGTRQKKNPANSRGFGRCPLRIICRLLADVRLAGLGADDVDGVPGLLEAQARVLELEVFVNLLDEDCDFGHAGTITRAGEGCQRGELFCKRGTAGFRRRLSRGLWWSCRQGSAPVQNALPQLL